MRRLELWCRAVVLVGLLSRAAAASGDENLLKNGNFTAEAEGRPTDWIIRDSGQRVSLDKREKPEGAEQSLRLDVVRDAGENYGEILQVIKVKPATLYRVQGEVRVTRARLGIYQIKRYRDGKEISRISTDEPVPGRWQTLSREFSSDDAESVQVLCRWRQNRFSVGQTAWFAVAKTVELSAHSTTMLEIKDVYGSPDTAISSTPARGEARRASPWTTGRRVTSA